MLHEEWRANVRLFRRAPSIRGYRLVKSQVDALPLSLYSAQSNKIVHLLAAAKTSSLQAPSRGSARPHDRNVPDAKAWSGRHARTPRNVKRKSTSRSKARIPYSLFAVPHAPALAMSPGAATSNPEKNSTMGTPNPSASLHSHSIEGLYFPLSNLFKADLSMPARSATKV